MAAAAEQQQPFVRCPMLVRVFVRYGGHNDVAAYGSTPAAGVSFPANEMQFYLWGKTTLREITDLISEQRPEVRRPRVQLSFAVVYPDKLGRQTMKEVGKLSTNETRTIPSDQRTLNGLRFEAGDYLDVAILGMEDPELRQRRLSRRPLDDDHHEGDHRRPNERPTTTAAT